MLKKKHIIGIAVLAISLLVVLIPVLSMLVGLIGSWLPTSHNCVLGLADGVCNYQPTNIPVNFSMGEAVAAVGVFLAVVQLADPIRRIALRINKRLRNVGTGLLIAGFLSILVASIIPHLTFNSKLISYPIFWEVIGYMCFLIAPLIYFYATSKIRRLFKPKLKRARDFYFALLDALANGQPAYIEAVTRIFANNIEELTKAAKELSPFGVFSEDREIPKELEYAKYASDLIEIVLSEQKVAELLATQRIDILFVVLTAIKENDLRSYSAINGVEKIFEALYESPNSHLYNQLERSGLTLYAPLYEFLFADDGLFFVSHMHALSAWNRYGVKDSVQETEGYTKVYIEALETAVNKYGFSYASPFQELNNALSKLKDHAEKIARLEDKNERGKLSTNSLIMMAIETYLGHTFPLSYKDAVEKGTATDYEISASSNSRGYGSLTNEYAKVLAKFFEVFYLSGNDDENVRMQVHSLTSEVVPIHDDGSLYENIRTRFFEHIWKKIKDNVERGHYPVVIRYYLQEFNGEDTSQPQWRKDERNRLYAYMKTEVVPRLFKKELMLGGGLKEDKLLPDTIVFRRNTKRFYRKGKTSPIAWSIT